jgi:Ca2+-binding RTX toxin-like protein
VANAGDSVAGGLGNDLIVMNADDTVSGGFGDDSFVMGYRQDGFALITDFEADREDLVVDALLDPDLIALGPTTLSFVDSPDGTALDVFVNVADGSSALAVRLEGLSTATPISAALVTTPRIAA